MQTGERPVELARAFEALSYRSRLALLEKLRKPRTVDDIDLRPGNPKPGENADRVLTRQGIRYHLAKLREADLISVRDVICADGRRRQTFRVDPSGIFELVHRLEERFLVDRDGGASWLGVDETAGRNGGSGEPTGLPSSWLPAVVIVHGPGRGRVISLTSENVEPPRGWAIGSRQDAAVTIPHDAWVAPDHGEIVGKGDAFELIDLRTSGRPTMLDGSQIPLGGSRTLESGHVIGVGRSLLVFRAP